MKNALDLESHAKLTAFIFDKIKETAAEQGHVNILLAGRSGVGKSTLINAVFQGEMAVTGQGRPVTQEMREITKQGLPVSLFDTRGLEMSDFDATLKGIKKVVADGKKEADANKHIHLAWLCIGEDSRRVEDGDQKLIDQLDRDGIPVVVVITKARADGGFRSKVEELAPKARQVVRVRAIEEKDDDGHVRQPMGLEQLVEVSMNLVPEGQQTAFIAAQKASIVVKKNAARKIVWTAAGAAATVALEPIPFADAALIIPIQIGMILKISSIFGLPVNQKFCTSLLGCLAGVSGATLVGRTLAGGLIKCIPGIGTLVGGAINATVAGTITTGLGEAYITVLERLFESNGGSPPTEEQVLLALKGKGDGQA